MKIQLLPNDFTICKVSDPSEIDFDAELTFYAKTDEEISLICESSATPINTTVTEKGWKAFRICGVLDFGLIGILSKIASMMAKHQISISAVSTYNTDYIFVKEEQVQKATRLFSNNDYEIY